MRSWEPGRVYDCAHITSLSSLLASDYCPYKGIQKPGTGAFPEKRVQGNTSGLQRARRSRYLLKETTRERGKSNGTQAAISARSLNPRSSPLLPAAHRDGLQFEVSATQ